MTLPKNASLMSRIRLSKGFTLIEMAIVLVIIGIIIGAIVKGGDLIGNANDKKLKGEIDTFRATYNTYFDKFGSAPTDGSLTYANVGAEVSSISKAYTGVSYLLVGSGSLQVTGLTSEQIVRYDNKYDDSGSTTGDVRFSSSLVSETGAYANNTMLVKLR